MAFFDTTWYVNHGNGSSTGYWAVTQRPQNAAVAAGILRRQFTAPSVGNERVFICIVAGTTANTVDATWTLTRGAKSTDGTATWQECTGASAVNGDLTNTPTWTSVKGTAITLGAIIRRDNGASYQICSTAGTAGGGSEPSFSDTAGTTTVDNTATWTSLGAVGNFTGGQAPHARLVPALANTWAAAGNTIYVDSASQETQAAVMTLLGPGTLASPIKVICHDGGAYPPASGNVTTGASLTTTGNNSIGYTSVGLYVYGIIHNSGSGNNATSINLAAAAGATLQTFQNCDFTVPSTSSASEGIFIGATANTTFSAAVWRNCRVKFGSVNQGLRPLFCTFDWKNDGATSAIISGSVVSNVFIKPTNTTANLNIVNIEGCDLSALSGTLVGTNVTVQAVNGVYTFKDCALHASATKYTFPLVTESPGFLVNFIRCNSGAVNYTLDRYSAMGTETTETTIVRTGGATDGSQLQSRKIVTTARSLWYRPFEMEPIVIWNDVVGSPITVIVYGIWGGGAVPNNDEVWTDVEYLGSSSAPVGYRLMGTKANILATGSAQSADSSVWGGSTTAFKMEATITPQMRGPITIYGKVGAASTTVYIDPKPALSVGGVSKSYILAPGVYVNEIGSFARLVSAQRGTPF